MGNDDSIKIRTLPRKNEKQAQEKSAAKSDAKSQSPRWIIYVGTTSSVLLFGLIVASQFDKAPAPATTATKVAGAKIQSTDMSSVIALENEAVNRHLQESHMRRDLMEQAQKLENARLSGESLEADPYTVDPGATFGVQMDQENQADKVYADLNANAKGFTESTPDEKINARLANRKWVNELERREKITFVRNFLRSAYDRGFEVELDHNLVVINVKRVKEPKKLNIDQIIDRLAAKQGF